MSIYKINPISIDGTKDLTISNVSATGYITITANVTAANASLGNLATANYFTGVLTTAAQPNITSVGTLSSLTVTANIRSGNANLGNLTTSNYFAGVLTTAAQPNITSVGNLTVANVTGNITTGNANLGNLVTANFFTGDGGLLSNITAGNITGAVASATSATSATTAGTVTTNAQPNITSVGSLTGLTLTANSNITLSGTLSKVSGANLLSATYLTGTLTTAAQPNITSVGNLTVANVTGNITTGNANLGNLTTSNYFTGNGSLLTSLTGANVTGAVAYATTANSVAGANVTGQVGNSLVAGTVYTAAQPNITSVGTLTSLSVTGNITAGNVAGGNLVSANYFSGNGSLLTNITGANVTGQVGNSLVAGTVYTAAQPNITSVGTLTSLSVTGNITAGNVAGGNLVSANYFSGNGSLLTSITGANVTGQVGNALVAGTVYTAAQPNITSVGSLTGLTVSNATGVVNFTTTANVTLGNVSNLHITGGSADYVLKTDGAGNLSWTAQSGGSSSLTAITVDNFTGNGVASSYTLSVTPSSVNSVFVNYNGAFVSRNSYSLSGATLTFGSIPANGANIEVTTIQGVSTGSGSFTTRTATGDNSTVNYTVSSGATVSSVLVTIDGVLQTPTTDYTISGTTLTFVTAPYSGGAIQIRELSIATAGGSALLVQDEGSNLTATANTINFVGSGVTASNVGNVVTVTVSGASNTSIRAQAMTMGIIFGG